MSNRQERKYIHSRIDELLNDEDLIKELLPRGMHNYYTNGKCSECGQCCTRFIDARPGELARIRAYLKRHPEIKRQKHAPALLAKPTADMMCPFLEANAKEHRCLIYPVRPYICKLFECRFVTDKEAWKDAIRKALTKDLDLLQAKSTRVDLLQEFFPDEAEAEKRAIASHDRFLAVDGNQRPLLSEYGEPLDRYGNIKNRR